jgi:hypothetical protein
MARRSFRTLFREFQRIRGSEPDGGFVADLEYLENRDLDLSVRLGAMLAFNALVITLGTHPISASPGAPLSLDANVRPVLTLLACAGIVPLVVSSWLCLKGLMIGEEFDPLPEDADQGARREQLFAAFIKSIDAQGRLLSLGVRWSMAGGGATLCVWAAILATKML